jgi:hypothetical protein
MMMEGMLNTGTDQTTLSSLPEFKFAIQLGAFHPGLALASSLGFCLVALALAAYQLAHTDY